LGAASHDRDLTCKIDSVRHDPLPCIVRPRASACHLPASCAKRQSSCVPDHGRLILHVFRSFPCRAKEDHASASHARNASHPLGPLAKREPKARGQGLLQAQKPTAADQPGPDPAKPRRLQGNNRAGPFRACGEPLRHPLRPSRRRTRHSRPSFRCAASPRTL